MIIYGINPVAEAIKAGTVREIRVAERADERLQRLLAPKRTPQLPTLAEKMGTAAGN